MTAQLVNPTSSRPLNGEFYVYTVEPRKRYRIIFKFDQRLDYVKI